MVKQVTDTEPTMAKSSCSSVPACSVLWLPRLGGTLSTPDKREGQRVVVHGRALPGLH